jgi:mono/diheme cytochrome c family protein
MRQIVSSVCGALVVAAAFGSASAAGAADPREGEALYVGSTPLQNGGAPCLACHGLAGHGLAWSASFGPDLSTAAETYDAETLATVLEDVPFPSMEPIYRGHAITEGERANLAAFLLEARAPVPASDARGRLLLEAGLVAAAILALLVVLYRRRMPPVSATLARARRAEGGTR